MPEDRYSDEAARKILDEAAALQARADEGKLPAQSRFTVQDLEAIAAEAGIAPEHVRTAVQRVAPSSGTALAIHQENPRFVVHRREMASDVSDEEWGRIVQELRLEFEQPGAATDYGDIREWIGGTGSMQTHVRVLPSEANPGRWEIEVRQDSKSLADMYTAFPTAFGMLTAFIGVLAFNGEAPWLAPILLAVLAAGSWWVPYQYVQHWKRKQTPRIEALMDRMELIARSSEAR